MKKYLLLLSVVIIGVILSGCNPDETSPDIEQNTNFKTVYEVFSEEPNWVDAVTVSDETDAEINFTESNFDTTDVNMDVIGEYDVVFNVSDSSGNKATKTITIEVVDTTVPELSTNLNQLVFEIYTQGIDWKNGISAEDAYDGEIILKSENVDTTDVNLDEIGTYEVTYTVEDSSGNISTLTIPVYVVDETVPVLDGVTELTYEVNDSEPDWLSFVSASDNCDENIELTLYNVNLSEVDMSTTGTFNVTYTYIDSNENQSVPHVITVTILDNDNPLLTLNGMSEIYIGLGREYIDLGAEFTDNYDDNYTVFDNQTVDTSTPGDYIITYNVLDTSGNQANTITRTVHVIEDFSFLFNDEQLVGAIRDELNKDIGPITQDDLESIQYLEADYEDIYDLKGIEYLVNLRKLDLGENYIFDLEPLSNLTNLEILYLYENSISDITPLSNLVKLKELDLYYNQISDITPLNNLINLKELYLDYNQISDITPLSNLINLKELYLDYNQISNLEPILSQSEITYLSLKGNNLTDITDLKTMYDNGIFTGRSNIYLGSNSLDLNEGTEAYNVITYLVSNGIYLDIARDIITDDYGNDKTTASLVGIETPVNGVINYNGDNDWFKFTITEETNLVIYTESSMSTNIFIYYDNGSYISTIKGKGFGGEDYNSKLNNITLQVGTYYLYISTKDYDGAEEIVGSYNLIFEEYISEPGSPDVVFVDSNLENVIRLELNKLTGSITQADCESIGSLYANYRNISDLSGIEYLTNLTYLNLSGNNISDLTPLQNLTSIEFLMLDNNEVSDISVLNNLSNLKLLEIDRNNISDISVLQTLFDSGAFNDNLKNLDYEIRLDRNPIDIYIGSEAYNIISYLNNNNVRLDLNNIFISDDHGNTYTEATNIEIGSSISGKLDFFNDRDLFKFTITEETELIIYTITYFDTYIYLYDENMNLINEGSNSIVLKSLLDGTYYLRVEYKYVEEISHYDLYIESITDDHANSFDNATSVEIESISEGSLNYLYDRDVFTFTLQQESEVLIFTTGSIDIEVCVSDQISTNICDTNIATTLPAGTYFVEVSSSNTPTTGEYQLYIEEKIDLHSDIKDSATTISLGTSIDGIIHSSNRDYDWFKLTIIEETDVMIYTTSSSKMYGYIQYGTNNYSYTNVYRTEDDNMIIIKTLTPGTYYIKIYGFIGNYKLHVQEVVIDDDYGNDIDNAESISVGTIFGEINYNGDEDYFKLVLTEETDVKIYTIGIPMDGLLTDNLMIEIDPYDSSKITTRLPAGTYYIKFNSYFIGDYELHIEEINITDDYGDSSEDATPITINSQLSGILNYNGDQDWFVFTLTEENDVSIYTTSLLDTYGYLYDENLNLITENDDDGEDGNFSIVGLLPAGTYYLRVKEYDAYFKGQYYIHFENNI